MRHTLTDAQSIWCTKGSRATAAVAVGFSRVDTRQGQKLEVTWVLLGGRKKVLQLFLVPRHHEHASFQGTSTRHIAQRITADEGFCGMCLRDS